jgi:hypothetical protein
MDSPARLESKLKPIEIIMACEAGRISIGGLCGTGFGADLRKRLPGCDRLAVDPELEKSRPTLGECPLERVWEVL